MRGPILLERTAAGEFAELRKRHNGGDRVAFIKMNSYTAIRNYEALVKFLGKWPSFDDFEVVSILLKRSDVGEEFWPTLTAEFRGFRHDVLGESPDRNDCLIVLRFGGLENLMLNGFNHQNAVNGLVVNAAWSERRKRDLFAVDLIQGFGVGAKFECIEIDLVSVTPIEI